MQCDFIKKNHEQCGAPALTSSRFCFWHDPAKVIKQRKARRRGGLNRRIARPDKFSQNNIKTLQDLINILENTIDEVLTLENSESQITTVGYLYKVIDRVQGYIFKNRIKELKQMMFEIKRDIYLQYRFS